ncbi:uncharacterized protein LOC144354725, partial [Saccoglossus kowalevskii]
MWLLVTAILGEKLTPNGECNADGTICEFNFDVSHKETMIFYDHDVGTGSPVIVKNGRFYRRDSFNCNVSVPMTERQLNDVIVTDGSYRHVMVINGQLPGPPIIVKKDTQVVVNVKNSLLMEGLTIHWHGIRQYNTPWMDGTGHVTQCPINPGETFTYRFIANPAGTHWYHSHVGVQFTEGIHGPLIILEDDNKLNKENDLPDFAGEFVIVLNDWMREPALSWYLRYHAKMEG